MGLTIKLKEQPCTSKKHANFDFMQALAGRPMKHLIGRKHAEQKETIKYLQTITSEALSDF